ncbi:MAG: hypothetical protein ABIH41_06010 [Nanoarchaeota archaeon]
MKRIFMSLILALILGRVLMVVFVGCGQADGPADSTSATDSPKSLTLRSWEGQWEGYEVTVDELIDSHYLLIVELHSEGSCEPPRPVLQAGRYRSFDAASRMVADEVFLRPTSADRCELMKDPDDSAVKSAQVNLRHALQAVMNDDHLVDQTVFPR